MNEAKILKDTLLTLAVSPFDAELYLTALDQGETTITRLAQTMRVERPTIYAALARLEELGLFSANRQSHARKIIAEPPSRVLALLEQRKTNLTNDQDKLERLLPQLLSSYASHTNKSAFRLFEGKKQFLIIFEEALKEAENTILYYGNAKAFIDYVGYDYEQQWIKKRVKRGISIKILVLLSALTKHFKSVDSKEMRETRFLPTENHFESSYMIYGAKTLIWNPVAERAIVIEDNLITDMFRQSFETAWRNGLKR